MSKWSVVVSAAGFLCVLNSSIEAGDRPWVEFANETATRLPTPPNLPELSTTDNSERSYAWGDVDHDDDLDLVVARRPAYAFGSRTNVLFINEGVADGHAIDGVLIDRTAEFAVDSSVKGDMGFLTPTSDRDVILVDVNGDDWLDIVTAPAWTDGQPKHLSHPRIYLNKGMRGKQWQGFRFENDRFPQLHKTEVPRFSMVAAGDVTGDGFADLFFTDFDNSEAPLQTPTFDFNNRLLINDGSGFFTDETAARLTSAMSGSAYGTSAVIADINGDSVADIVRDSANLPPFGVAIIYNDPKDPGIFAAFETVYGFPANAYYTSAADLNNDSRIDLIITDNSTDQYLLNQGTRPDGTSMFSQHAFPFLAFDFGGNSYAADLDNDDFPDVLITDMDIDVPGCFRRAHLYHNLANPPAVSFEETEIIPFTMMTGTHDAAVFDINADGWDDIILGRCTSTQVWINQPPDAAPGDLNGDGVVDGLDLGILLSNWTI